MSRDRVRSALEALVPALGALSSSAKNLKEVDVLLTRLDQITTRLIVRWGWREDPQRILERITAFEATEDDSAWQLLRLSALAREPKAKAKLFLQSLEESHHAEVFRELHHVIAANADARPFQKFTFERKALVLDEKHPWRLFAELAVGESAAARRFRSIAESLPHGEFRVALLKILAEEEGHVELASELMSRAGGLQPWQATLELSRIRAVRMRSAWLRIGNRLVAVLCRGLLTAVFYLFGGLLSSRRKGHHP
jgi:hypothetical protein